MMLMKVRARKPLFNVRHSSVALAPYGVGGVLDRDGKMTEVASIKVDNYTLHISLDELSSIVQRIKATKDARRVIGVVKDAEALAKKSQGI